MEKEHEKKVILSEALERGQLVDHCVDSTCFSVVRGFVSRKLVYEMVIREKKTVLVVPKPLFLGALVHHRTYYVIKLGVVVGKVDDVSITVIFVDRGNVGKSFAIEENETNLVSRVVESHLVFFFYLLPTKVNFQQVLLP